MASVISNPGETVRIFLSVLFGLGLSASPARAQNVSEVQVTPEAVTLRVGQKQALFAAAFDPGGNLIPTARFTYASNNVTVAQAQSDGVVIGLKAGAAIVRVASGQKFINVAVTVEAGATPEVRAPDPAPAATQSGPPPTMLTIDPTPVYLLPSENRRLTVRGFREDGSAADVPRVTWKSLTPETATVDGDGNVVGLAAGHAIVQASVPGGLAATTPVEIVATDFAVVPVRLVLAPGDLDTLLALVPAQANRDLRTGLQWRSAAPEVVRVGPTGIVQAMAPGETEIIVTGFFQERRLPVRVHPPVQTLVVSPKPSAGVLRVPLHGTRALSVRAEAADSTPVPEAALWWEVADSTIVSFDAAHTEITARRLGTTSVTLRARGFDPVTWVVEVIPGGIALDHQQMALVIGARGQLKASLTDDSGAPMGPADDLQWSTSNLNVAAVGNDGAVEATSFGRATVVAATPWGRADTAVILVTGDLIFSANRGGPTFGIYQLALRDPSRVVPILADSFQNVQAVPSPDRSTLAFSSNRGGDFDLYLMDADGTNLRRISSGPGADGDPAWTPDGRRLIFSSARSGSSQIYSIAVDGTDLHPLTTAGGGNSAPTVSPDGRTIAFVSGRDGNDEIYRMDVDGGNQTNLSATRERETAPRFLASGDLAYAAEVRHNGFQVVRLPVDGTPAITLATSAAPITAFAVSADGTRLAIVAGRVTDPRRGRAEFTFSIQSLSGGAPFQVPMLLNEQVVTPHF
jgi:uncharacterized protein YjdB